MTKSEQERECVGPEGAGVCPAVGLYSPRPEDEMQLLGLLALLCCLPRESNLAGGQEL